MNKEQILLAVSVGVAGLVVWSNLGQYEPVGVRGPLGRQGHGHPAQRSLRRPCTDSRRSPPATARTPVSSEPKRGTYFPRSPPPAPWHGAGCDRYRPRVRTPRSGAPCGRPSSRRSGPVKEGEDEVDTAEEDLVDQENADAENAGRCPRELRQGQAQLRTGPRGEALLERRHERDLQGRSGGRREQGHRGRAGLDHPRGLAEPALQGDLPEQGRFAPRRDRRRHPDRLGARRQGRPGPLSPERLPHPAHCHQHPRHRPQQAGRSGRLDDEEPLGGVHRPCGPSSPSPSSRRPTRWAPTWL